VTEPLNVVSGSELEDPGVGLRVIRGGLIRVAGYGLGIGLAGIASIALLRYLGVSDYGRYATVISLVAIVGGVTEAGLSAVSPRDLARRPPGEPRRQLLRNLMGLRLAVTPLGVVVALAFALAVGYERNLVAGLVIAGTGLVLAALQETMALPLNVELRVARVTAIDVCQQAVTLVGVGVLVAVGAGLTAFFAVPVVAAAAAIVATRVFVGRRLVWRPAFDRAEWGFLIREVLPLAAASVINVVYLRVLLVLTSVLSTARETGLFATSFRITSMLLGLSSIVLSVVVPVLAVAAADRARLRLIFQRLLEVGVMSSLWLAVVVTVVAEPVLVLLAGDQYRDAAPVLRIQVFALVPLFFGQACGVVLVAIHRQSVFLISGLLSLSVALVAGFALIPPYGAIGAGIGSLVAETVLATTLFVLLVRSDPALRPSFGAAWKLLVAAGLALAAGILPGLPAVAAAVLETVVYASVLWVTRAIPPEVFTALRLPSRVPRVE
jgi:O-antigen/teichoic acid export membrane protein